jgi:AcrR family transcriptional regulator
VTGRGRPRVGAADNRARILAAARDLFADHGYDRATIRAIAERARVDPALVYHYFDDKHALLVAALAPPDGALGIYAAVVDRDRAGEELVSQVIAAWDSDPEIRAYLAATLRTALSHEEGAALLRDNQRALILAAVGHLVREDHYDLRLALISAQLAGVLLMRYVIRSPALVGASTDQLVATVGPILQHYISGHLTAADLTTAVTSRD